MFEIIPAIDISDSKCVRLKHGKKSEETVFSDNPLEMAEKWILLGATRIHIVDLDGAFTGSPKIFEIVKKIVAKFSSNVFIQIGGGIRNMQTIGEEGCVWTLQRIFEWISPKSHGIANVKNT